MYYTEFFFAFYENKSQESSTFKKQENNSVTYSLTAKRNEKLEPTTNSRKILRVNCGSFSFFSYSIFQFFSDFSVRRCERNANKVQNTNNNTTTSTSKQKNWKRNIEKLKEKSGKQAEKLNLNTLNTFSNEKKK